MNPVVRNILAVVAGIVVGMAVNMGILLLGMMIVPAPEGVDPMNAESIAANIDKYEIRHFVGPFLAHALGTLAGALIAARIAASYKMAFALVIGAAFLLAGIINVMQIPAPMWFNALDLALAYLPMGYLGGRLVTNARRS